MAQEIEIKLEASPAALERLEASGWLGRHADAARREEQLSIYFDTPTLDLRDEGVALRVRQIGRRHVQTVKAARPAQPLSRAEFERELEGGAPDLKRARGAERRVTKKLQRRLLPVFETRVERTIVPLRRHGAELELAIDRGEIRVGKKVEPIGEIEVELKGGELDALVQMARALADEFEVRYGVRSKAERGYALFEKVTAKAARAEDIELTKSIRAGAGFQLIGLACLRHFALNEQALRRGDPEGVHQMRVGVRRLRAAMSLFEELAFDDETANIKAELRWLVSQLGPVRDLDVLLAESLAPLKAATPHATELDKLESALRETRQQKVELARAAVRSDRYRKLVLEVALWLLGGNWTRASSERLPRLRQRRLKSLARRALAKRTAKVGKKLDALEQLDDHRRHKLRIAVKKLHYAAEFFATLFPRGARRRKRYVELLKELQDSLGRLNDIHVHAALARELVQPGAETAAPTPGREEAFGMGLLMGTEQAEARALLKASARTGRQLTHLPAFWH